VIFIDYVQAMAEVSILIQCSLRQVKNSKGGVLFNETSFSYRREGAQMGGDLQHLSQILIPDFGGGIEATASCGRGL